MLLNLKKLFCAMCLLPLLMSAEVVSRQTVVIEGFGETIALATKNARENVIRNVFGEVVDSVTEVKNDELIESTITASSGFIISCHLASKPQYDEKNKCYHVKIRAIVATDRVKDHIRRFQKRTRDADIAVDIKASEIVEEQEKNAMALLKWWCEEAYKATSFSNFRLKVNGQEKSVVFGVNFDYDIAKREQLKNAVKKVLLNNGYKRVPQLTGTDSLNWMLGAKKYNGSLIALRHHKHEKFEFFNNTKAILFHSEYSQYAQHPQNASYQLPKVIAAFALIDRSENLLYTYNCSVPYLNVCFGGPYPNPGGGGVALLINDKLEDERSVPLACEAAWQDKFKAACTFRAEVYLVWKDKKVKRVVTKDFPVNGNDLATQFASLADRDKDLQDLIINTFREVHKCLIPEVKYEYDRFKKKGVLAITTRMDNRKYVALMRKVDQQLGNLGHERLSPDEARNMYGNFRYDMPGGRRFGFKLACNREFMDELCNKLRKHKYFVRVKFRDADGNVLQTEEYEIRAHASPVEAWAHRGVDFRPATRKWYRKEEIKFDLPEDYNKVKKTECEIVERIAK